MSGDEIGYHDSLISGDVIGYHMIPWYLVMSDMMVHWVDRKIMLSKVQKEWNLISKETCSKCGYIWFYM